jgi:hypothetical protein
MQAYNDNLGRVLLRFLGLKEGTRMPARRFLAVAAGKMPAVESTGTLAQDAKPRFKGLGEGLRKLGITASS